MAGLDCIGVNTLCQAAECFVAVSCGKPFGVSGRCKLSEVVIIHHGSLAIGIACPLQVCMSMYFHYWVIGVIFFPRKKILNSHYLDIYKWRLVLFDRY